MSDKPIARMTDKELRKEVQFLRDELAIMRRKFEDILYNLDYDNFSSSLIKEKDGMKAEIEISAEAIKTKVSKEDLEEQLSRYSTITQTAEQIELYVGEKYETKADAATRYASLSLTVDAISTTVSNTYETKADANAKYAENKSEIKQTASAIRLGVIESDNSSNYTSCFEITNEGALFQQKTVHLNPSTGEYYTYSRESKKTVIGSSGIRFYDSSGTAEGWAIEHDTSTLEYGGYLHYYTSGYRAFAFGIGQGLTGSHSNSDLVLKALNEGNNLGRFVVDLTYGANREVKFVGLNDISAAETEPRIFANEKLLATQDWVKSNGSVAVFG